MSQEHLTTGDPLEDAEMRKGQVLDLATDLKVGPALLELKALGDALLCIGIAGSKASLLDGTLQSLGLLIIDKVTEVGVTLGVMKA